MSIWNIKTLIQVDVGLSSHQQRQCGAPLDQLNNNIFANSRSLMFCVRVWKVWDAISAKHILPSEFSFVWGVSWFPLPGTFCVVPFRSTARSLSMFLQRKKLLRCLLAKDRLAQCWPSTALPEVHQVILLTQKLLAIRRLVWVCLSFQSAHTPAAFQRSNKALQPHPTHNQRPCRSSLATSNQEPLQVSSRQAALTDRPQNLLVLHLFSYCHGMCCQLRFVSIRSLGAGLARHDAKLCLSPDNAVSIFSFLSSSLASTNL